MKSFKTVVAAGLLALMFGTGQASAEMIYNRGGSEPQSLDPHKSSTTAEGHILRDLFDGLVSQDKDANLIPGAAESWTASADGKSYIFKLRKDGLWSDGSPVTADDFVFSWRRVVDPKTGSEYASMAYPILNAEEINAGKADPQSLGVKAVDKTTLEVTLKAPTPYFLEMLTHMAMYGVSEANVKKFGDDFVKPGNMVSNGAFTLKSFTPNDKIVLVKNPKFHAAASVKLDVVNYIPGDDLGAAMKRYAADELDSSDGLPTEQLDDIVKKYGDQVHLGPQLSTYYYIFKAQKAPWNNPKLRNAVSMVIDRDYLAEKVYAKAMWPAYGMVPAGIAGYESRTMEYASMSQIDREDAAKKIFDELGISPDKPLQAELRYNTSENHKNVAVAIQGMLKPFGVELSLVNTDGKSHYSYLEQKGDFDIARAAWVADFKDPVNFLNLGKTGDGNNHGEYSNPEFDSLLDKASVEADPKARMKMLSDAEAILLKEAGLLPLMFYSSLQITKPYLKGFSDNVMDVHPSRFITIEK